MYIPDRVNLDDDRIHLGLVGDILSSKAKESLISK